MPPALPAPNILAFPDLPSTTRATQVPAFLQNTQNIVPSRLSNCSLSVDAPSLTPAKYVLFSSTDAIVKANDTAFNSFLGELHPPHFDEALPLPETSTLFSSGTLLHAN